ncbi:MAG: cytochrome c [Myxococcota bacterium]|nr:cytochrome c [Myxococcota bacterium]
MQTISHYALALACVAGCSASDGDDAADALFAGTASAALGGPGNEARCITCHSAAGAHAGDSGTSLEDIAFRASFKGGEAPALLAGVNACVTGWMGGVALTTSDARWERLEAYLVGISDPAVTTPNPLAPEVLADEAAYALAYRGGDASAGRAKYDAACARCHDGGLQVGPAVAPSRASLDLGAGVIAQKVRTSGPPPSGMGAAVDATPGPMPFFEPRDLSAQDLKDIVAFLTN